jgi:hypothetical protein
MPPETCPDIYKEGIEVWDKEPLDLLKAERVPWMVINRLAREGWVTLSHLANRWKNKEDVETNAAKELDFNTGKNHYTMNDERRAYAGIKYAWSTANKIKDSRTENLHINPNLDPALIMVAGQRESMERVYETQTGKKPPLDEQGSDHFLGGLFKECSKGNIGSFNNAEIVPKIPEPHTYMKQITNRRRDEDGRWVESETTERAEKPQDYESWKRQMLVFRASLLMAIFSNPTQTALQITKTKLDDFYKFLYGTELAGRSPQPPVTVMMYAERLAWRKIALEIHTGVTLEKAIDQIQANSMFWQHEVGDKCRWNPYKSDHDGDWTPTRKHRGKGGNPWSPAKGEGKASGKDYQQQTYHNARWDYNNDDSGKGQGKGKASGKHGGKGGKDDGKSGGKGGKAAKKPWVSKTNKGQWYCWDYQKGKCTQGKRCPNSHMCPFDQGDGTGCNKAHYLSVGHKGQ